MNKANGAKILVVDDDRAHGEMLADVLRERKYDPIVVEGAREAMDVIERGGVDGEERSSAGNGHGRMPTGGSQAISVIVTDLRMPEVGGFELIEWASKHDPRIVIVAITAFGSLETAIKAVRIGAFDYLSKPFEPEALLLAVDKALAERALRSELASLRKATAAPGKLVAKSAAMREVLGVVEQVAPMDVSVLITGPSGVGKELVARALHDRSHRASGPFVAVNCAAIPSELLESELFGVRKGAFTDARSDRAGLFREAHGGTLFLDEIGDLPVAMQPKLLRVLQEREVRPLGGGQTVSVDVRVVAATRHDLRRAVGDGSFREDLFYRLAVVEIGIPALRERPDDVVPLAEAALARASARTDRPHRTLSGAAIRKLLMHGWPGNVRELENAIERAVALCPGDVILPEHLPPSIGTPPPVDFLRHAVDLGWTIDELNRAYLHRVLERTGGNKKQAAALMGIDRRTIQRWLGEEQEGDEPRRVPALTR